MHPAKSREQADRPTAADGRNDGQSAAALAEVLGARRRTFVWPLLMLSLIAYSLGLVALGYAKAVVATPVFGTVNVAYLLAIGLILLTFAVAWIYTDWARRHFDPLVDQLRAALHDVEKAGVQPEDR